MKYTDKIDETQYSTGFLLWQVTSLWQRHLNALLKRHNLTHAQFVVLVSSYWLDIISPPVTQVKIATHAKMDVMLTSNILKTLEKKKLVLRSHSKTDTRAKEVKITQKGTALVHPALEEVEAFDKKFFSALKGDLSAFDKQLQNLIAKNKNI
jgi:DNA-binding MarR family transcriptional regulator